MTRPDLILILGDQLCGDQASLKASNPERSVVFMAEVQEESRSPRSSAIRSALFLSAMRHFAQQLRDAGWTVDYLRLGQHTHLSLSAAWAHALAKHQPERVLCTEPGDWRVEQQLTLCCKQAGRSLHMLVDDHFLINRSEFSAWAGKSRTLQMERFYRHMRVRHQVLVRHGEPEGGQWNFDAENRASFGKRGPGNMASPKRFEPDPITREVICDLKQHLPELPGALDSFDWPVTRGEALVALKDFTDTRLSSFGRTQDAMWTNEPYLHHSLVSASLNLKLLNPREVIAAAEQAYREERASLASVEGFIRQILGWREFMRGVYWLDMPAMRQANHFDHQQSLPDWFWTGQTHMNCLRESIKQTLERGYAHHIQRLMVIGNFALLAGIQPQAVQDWFLAVYVDAVGWVELPNVAGMALYANGGRFTTKPYCASGAYIKRMSNYCTGCRYDPTLRTGTKACPMSTFYWDFLIRNEAEMTRNPRAALMMKHVAALSESDREKITQQASLKRADLESI